MHDVLVALVRNLVESIAEQKAGVPVLTKSEIRTILDAAVDDLDVDTTAEGWDELNDILTDVVELGEDD